MVHEMMIDKNGFDEMAMQDCVIKSGIDGLLIIARVFVGEEYVVEDTSCGKFMFSDLQEMGYDSIYAPNGSGDVCAQRVVYNWDQVHVLSVEHLSA